MSSNSEINSVSSLEFCQRIMARLVSDIYYNKQNNSNFLLDKVKSIRSLNDSGNKRLKYVLSELISNSDTILKNFKPINTNYKKNKLAANNLPELKQRDYAKINVVLSPTIHKNKEYLIETLGINKSKKNIIKRNNWVNATSSDEDETKEDETKEEANEGKINEETNEDETNEDETKEDETNEDETKEETNEVKTKEEANEGKTNEEINEDETKEDETNRDEIQEDEDKNKIDV